MSKMNWERLRDTGRRAASDVSDAWRDTLTLRRAVASLGPTELLARARIRYRRHHRATGKNPFCLRCTKSIKRRRFAELCSRCLASLITIEAHTR